MHHEEVARPLICDGEVADDSAARARRRAPERIVALIRGESDSPLQGLISGSHRPRQARLPAPRRVHVRRELRRDRRRPADQRADARRAIPDTGQPRVGMIEKGLSALESLLFAQYQMYRNVYWHHAVRSATAMYKRLVADALDAGALDARTLAGFTDEGILHAICDSARRTRCSRAFASGGCTSAPSSVPPPICAADAGEWIADDRTLTVAVEDALARELGLAAGRVAARLPDQDADARPRSARPAPVRRSAPRDRRRLGGRDQSAQALRRVLSLGPLAPRLHIRRDSRSIPHEGDRARQATRARDEVRARLDNGTSLL